MNRLIRESLQPPNAREEALRRGALIEDVANDVRTDDRHLVSAEHTLDMQPGPGLVAHQMQDVPDHSIANGNVRGVRVSCGKLGKLLRQRQSGTELTPIEKAGPQSPNGP